MSDFEDDLDQVLSRGRPDGHGNLTDAKWLDPAELAGREWRCRDDAGRAAGLLLGYRDGRAIGWLDDRHVLVVAGARGGKTVSFLGPNLLMYDGNVLVIDPKGELAKITARARRAKGHKVIVLDPFRETGFAETHRFNPLAELDPDGIFVKDDMRAICSAMIPIQGSDPHWSQSAQNLWFALGLLTLTMPPEERNLITAYRLATLTHPSVRLLAERGEIDRVTALFKLMQSTTGVFDDSIAAAGEQFAAMAEKERSSVFSTLLSQLSFLDSRAMADVLQTSDVRLSELKTGKTTIYLCLPGMRMDTHARWLRVIIDLALVAIEREKTKPPIPVLMLLDEFAVLGHMKSIEKAAGLMAGYGVKLCVVLQNLSQLEQNYKASWQTFVANIGVFIAWANTDKMTLEHLSEKLGQTGVRIMQPSGASAAQKLAGASSVREELRVQRLVAPNELEALLARRNGRILIKSAGYDPIILKRIVYYEDKPFAGLFDE